MSAATVAAGEHEQTHAPVPAPPPAVALTVEPADEQSRALAVLRFVLLIPQVVAVAILTVVWTLTTIAGYLAVLITGRYPEGLWNFNAGALRWVSRVWAYAYFLTDRYPSFSTGEVPGYPVQLIAERPENGRVERWRGLFAPIVALPFTLLALVLDAVCLLLAWIPLLSILFTRHNPRWSFGLYAFALRWGARSIAYSDALVRRPPHFPPNLARAMWGLALGVLFAAAVDIPIRALQHYHPVVDSTAILLVALIAAPLFFLVGLGGFDYWFYWAAGRPSRPEDHSAHGARSWKDYFRINTDHKVIGIQYTVTSFFFLLVGGLLAMLMRAELAAPGMQFVDSQTFNGLFSVHASILIFLFVIPVFAGFANYVLPLMIGAPDMAFPRLNALSYWLLPLAGTMMLLSFFAPGGSFATGWTAYAPLSTDAPIGQMFFTIGVQFAGASSVMTALNFLVTIITMRAPGMSFWRMPLLVWANFSTSLLVVIATPFIAASQFFVLLDRGLGFNFFESGKGGDVLMYQHVFWFYSHPAVYIMMLPGFGIISEIIAVKSRKPIFGYRMMAFSLLAIVVLGFTVWAHHMFVSGMQSWIRIPMMITTAIIAVPTGIKVFSWLATMWRGVLKLDTPMLFALGFLTMFVIGGISGVMLAIIPIDIHVSDTYFIVAHIHYVLFGGSLFTIFAGVYSWFPKMTGRMFDERLGKLHFWLTFVFFNCTFAPMHIIGLEGMPRRVADYSEQFAGWNLFISLSAFVLGASMLVFLWNMVSSWVAGPRAPANPWRSLTLEWQVSSPPPIFNFDSVPTVVGGPYEYGVPGAVHGIFKAPAEAKPTPAGAGTH
ncbi:MAG TPA: cytochrome c oxidase subunit I [Solirubrobacteraceae bacterium]|nr:cytochrome c oxidase subunit I [Solirubrobacteraceae bacterium]